MNLRARLLALLLAGGTLPLSQALFPGCATMMNGPRQEIRVRSKPVAAAVFVDGRRIGTTPATAFISRWGTHRVRIELAGYQPYDVKLRKTLSGNAEGNLFLGGVWIVVDVLTGAIFEQEVPHEMREPASREFPEEFQEFNFDPSLFVVTKLKPDPSSRKIGQMERR